MTRAGSPHSDTLGSQPASRLPEAYRRPPRPSSAPDAKASTERPKKQNTNPTKDKQTTDHTPTQPGGGAARATQRTKILASTIQITTNPPTAAPTSTPPAGHHTGHTRAHRPRTRQHTPHPTPPNKKGGPGQDAQPHHTHAPQTPRRPQQPPRTRAHAAGTARRVPCTTNPAPHRRQTPRSTTPPENRPPAYGRQRPCPPASPPEEKAP